MHGKYLLCAGNGLWVKVAEGCYGSVLQAGETLYRCRTAHPKSHKTHSDVLNGLTRKT